MHLQKVYLDTSAISHLIAEDTPEKMMDTLMFWKELRQGKYLVVLSNITLAEINKCSEPKRTGMYEYLNELECMNILMNWNIICSMKLRNL